MARCRGLRRSGRRSTRRLRQDHRVGFDSPAKAVAAAREILSEVTELGIEMRAGVHTGEITLHDDDIAGIGVHIASRVMSRAPDGRIAASRTVKDLTVGSAIQYEPLGTFQLKGVPGDWELFEVS